MARVVALFVALFAAVEGARIQKRRSSSLASCGGKGAGFAVASNETGISIVNGEPAKQCEWKWQVGLRSQKSLPASCGGMLISRDWVLTAAHCIGGGRINIVAGKYNLYSKDSSEQNRWSKDIIVHPSYSSSTMEWDMALIKLESPMEMSECVGSVCLPEQGADVAPGTNCFITGWGTLRSGGLFQPRQLQQGEVTILSNEACKKTDYSSDEIRPSMLCAQGRNANGIVDACQGDSGGPLVCESASGWTLYGATSWGYGCAGENLPGVWARVHEGLGWIDETMGN